MTLFLAAISLLSACGEVVLPDAEALTALRSAKAGPVVVSFEGLVVDPHGVGIKDVKVDIMLYSSEDPDNGSLSESVPSSITDASGKYGFGPYRPGIYVRSMKVAFTDTLGRYAADSLKLPGYGSSQNAQTIIIPAITLRAL